MALKPIYVWFAKRWSDAEWSDFQNDAEYQTASETVSLAAEDLGLGPSDGGMYAYRVIGDKIDDTLKLGRFQLPQLLFSTPVDVADPKRGQMFLGKLVQDQINRKNVATMLKAIRLLETRVDPSGKVEFYNPALNLPGIGISNLSDAPGSGYMIGFNPVSESLTVNRYGQMLSGLFDGFKKAIPWLLIGLGIYKLTED